MAILQMMKLSLREVGTFLWSQSCRVGWMQYSVAVPTPICQTGTLSTFYTGKAKKVESTGGISVGTKPGFS